MSTPEVAVEIYQYQTMITLEYSYRVEPSWLLSSQRWRFKPETRQRKQNIRYDITLRLFLPHLCPLADRLPSRRSANYKPAPSTRCRSCTRTSSPHPTHPHKHTPFHPRDPVRKRNMTCSGIYHDSRSCSGTSVVRTLGLQIRGRRHRHLPDGRNILGSRTLRYYARCLSPWLCLTRLGRTDTP